MASGLGGLFGSPKAPPPPAPPSEAPPPVTTDLAELARQRAARQARRQDRAALIVDPNAPAGGVSTGLGIPQ